MRGGCACDGDRQVKESPVIAGVAEVPHGRFGASTMRLCEELFERALRDAGLEKDCVDALFTVAPRSDPYQIHAAALAERLAIQPHECMTLEAGGGAPILMMRYAWKLVEAREVDAAVVVAADKPLTGMSANTYVSTLASGGPIQPEWEVPYAPSVPAMFGLVASRYMHDHRRTEKDLFGAVQHDHTMARLHPNAYKPQSVTVEEYMGARMISSPLRLYDCGPISDGGGAVVITTKARAARCGRSSPVLLAGVGSATTDLHLSGRPSLTHSVAGSALDRALAGAGMARSDIDIALIYDCFSIAMLVNLEDMGLVPYGEAGPALAAGGFGHKQPLVVNTHGGLLAHGYPGRAAGMSNLVEAIVQLRDSARERQVRDCSVALVHGMGGVFGTHAVAILTRGDL